MSDKVPIETYNQICRDLDKANETIKEMEIKIEVLNDRVERLVRENKHYRNTMTEGGL